MLLECPLDEARQSAERLRDHLKKAAINVSMGITEYQGSETVDSFVARADSALYKSKQAGRDRISIESAREPVREYSNSNFGSYRASKIRITSKYLS